MSCGAQFWNQRDVISEWDPTRQRGWGSLDAPADGTCVVCLLCIDCAYGLRLTFPARTRARCATEE